MTGPRALANSRARGLACFPGPSRRVPVFPRAAPGFRPGPGFKFSATDLIRVPHVATGAWRHGA